MQADTIEIRNAGSDADLARWASVKNEVAPADPVTPEQLRSELEGGRHTVLLLATLDRRLAGCGICAASSVAEAAFAVARVLPVLRRRGVGSALYHALSEHARRMGKRMLWTRALEADQAALAFLALNGFEEIGRECQSRLDLSITVGPSSAPAGVQIVSLDAYPELVPAVHALAVATSGDIPTAETFEVPALGEWRRENIDSALLAGSFVALLEDQVVGYAGLTAVPATPRTAENLLTAVDQAWRRRGVARALKAAQIEWARRSGFRELVTYNEAANEPMRRLNAQLGYRRLPDDLRFQGPLAAGRQAR